MAEERKKGGCGCAVIGCVLLLLLGAIGVGIVLVAGGAGALFLVAGSRYSDMADSIEMPAPPTVVVEEPVVAPVEAEGEEAEGEEAEGEEAEGEEAEGEEAEGEEAEGEEAEGEEAEGEGDETPASAARIRTPPPATSPAPTPPPEPVAPPPPTTSGTQVDVEGNAKVVLISGDRRYPVPGQVPPGSYDIEATFSDGIPVNVGRMTVGESGSHVVRCNENMGICRGS
jgi:hypothetical protein